MVASGPRVGLVLVSHSHLLAEGAVELAAQMAPGVVILAAGGTDDGGLGTSYDKVSTAMSEVLASVEGVVVLADLGSAVMTVDAVLEMDEAVEDRARLADAPFVEGAVAAAVAAHGGGSLDEVAAAAEAAATVSFSGEPSGAGPGASARAASSAPADDALQGRAVLRNRLGLHARPAATLARLVAGFDATVTIDGVDGSSVLGLMTLGTVGGQELAVTAVGPAAEEALAAAVEAIEGGFGEVED